MSLRGQDNEETSFFCLAPISMAIESKDFFQREPCFSSWNQAFMKDKHQAESSSGVEWMRGTVYNESEILGGYADEI